MADDKPLEITVQPQKRPKTESPAEKTATDKSQSASGLGPLSPTRQWIRQCTVRIGTGSKSLDVSQLRIRFRVRQADVQTPAHADVRIYNLSKATAQLIQKEFTEIEIAVGWRGGSLATIFKGEIKQKKRGRENPVETFLDVLATSADKAYNHAVVSKTLAAGHTFKDRVEAALDPMKKFGVSVGFMSDLGTAKSLRAATLFGMSRDVLRAVGFATNSSWHIYNGIFRMVKNDATIPGNTVVLNSETGMVGLPIQSIEGILVRCLMNPNIVPARLIKIDQGSIQEARQSPTYSAALQNETLPALADDGIYKAIVVEHEGDTEGQAWYTDVTCVRANGNDAKDGKVSIPPALAARGYNVFPDGSVGLTREDGTRSSV